MIMHQAAATMTGNAAIIALSIKMKKKEVKFQSVRKCYTIRNDFVDCCPAQPNSGYGRQFYQQRMVATLISMTLMEMVTLIAGSYL